MDSENTVMERYEIKKPEYIKTRKRVGHGRGSGTGKTCGRGQDGQKSRSGSSRRPWFEGGQMPLQRRVPKRGFNNIFKKQFQLVNVSQLEKISDSEITPEVLLKNGLIKDSTKLVKVLGNGELAKSFKVSADAFSQTAIDKIKKAGGDITVRELPSKEEASGSTE